MFHQPRRALALLFVPVCVGCGVIERNSEAIGNSTSTIEANTRAVLASSAGLSALAAPMDQLASLTRSGSPGTVALLTAVPYVADDRHRAPGKPGADGLSHDDLQGDVARARAAGGVELEVSPTDIRGRDRVQDGTVPGVEECRRCPAPAKYTSRWPSHDCEAR